MKKLIQGVRMGVDKLTDKSIIAGTERNGTERNGTERNGTEVGFCMEIVWKC